MAKVSVTAKSSYSYSYRISSVSGALAGTGNLTYWCMLTIILRYIGSAVPAEPTVSYNELVDRSALA